MNSKNKIVIIFLLFTLLYILNSCNDAPTDIGTNFLQDTIGVYSILNADSIIEDVQCYYYNEIQERNTGALLVGNANECISVGLIRFNIPTGKTDIKTDDISECTINFKLNNYSIGDTNNFAFNIKEINEGWDLETPIDDIVNQNIFKSDNIATWKGAISPNDTDFVIKIPFSKNLVVEWFDKIKDGINIKDTIWGIAIVPADECNTIASFKAISNFISQTGTFINIKYKSTDTTTDSIDIYSAEEVSFIKDNNILDNNTLTIQGGAKIHTKIKLNLENIPKLANTISGEITLFLNDSSISDNIPDTLFLNYFGDKNEIINNSMITIIGLYDSLNKVYTFKDGIANAINYLNRSSVEPVLVLTFRDNFQENNKIEKLNFLFNKNDKNKHINTKIFYSNI